MNVELLTPANNSFLMILPHASRAFFCLFLFLYFSLFSHNHTFFSLREKMKHEHVDQCHGQKLVLALPIIHRITIIIT